jgi:small-conductance mechanosensitive channel
MFLDLLSNDYVQIVLIFAGAMIGAKIIKEVVLVTIKKLTSKTKTDLDDAIIEIVSRPLYSVVFVIAAHYSILTFAALNGYLPIVNDVFYVVYVLLASYALSHSISLLVTRWMKIKKRFEKTPKLISKISGLAVYIIGLMIILDHFNVEIGPLLAALGVGGLAVGLALKDTLSNLFAGLQIVSDQPVTVGDYIKVEDKSGTVFDIGWRTSKIKTLGGNIIVIPNAKLAESIIVNYSLVTQESGATVTCGVAYDSDLEKVETIALEVATDIQKNGDGTLPGYEPGLRFKEFGDSNIIFDVFLRAENKIERMNVEHQFIKALKQRFDKEGIEISWPVVKIVKQDK